MWTTAFLRDLAERVVATFAQALAALLLAQGTGLLDASWTVALSAAGMTALLSLLKGIAAAGIDSETGASLLPNPPPRVDREAGAVNWPYVLLVVLLVVAILAVIGVL